MLHDRLPAYGTTALSRPAQQTPQTLPPRSHCSLFQSISTQNCNLTPRNTPALSRSTCLTSVRSSLVLAIPPHKF
ncbi:hypothetical protein K443DRAFT_595659 [Laccaria amethystina LaAM-08-1]|uniref:Uncharacterized protein n=1 Tax=Laccaria amethystina LaAM-08-1 TaxID=1095629 RepID=A0A0C9X6N7_9AGAR|nr:hypothetical protein K443DRAFT_595659 [Laccaria amethystina LaAM-08-1]